MAKETTHENRELEEKDAVMIYDDNSIDGTINRYNLGNLKSNYEKNANSSYYPSGEKSFKRMDSINETKRTYAEPKSNRNIFDEI